MTKAKSFENSKGYDAIVEGPGIGLARLHDARGICFHTGRQVSYRRLGQWEPGELRGSRRVLRGPGGAIPPGYSPHVAFLWFFVQF